MNITKKELDTLLISANRIYRYRKDILAERDLNKLSETQVRLRELIHSFKSIRDDLKVQKEIELINQFLLKIGGKIYPKTFWIDNVEVGLVALVIIIGIRTFFFQPFLIPTNSMYPTYSGMNEVIYELNAEKPTTTVNILNKILLGSKNYYLEAANDGRVSVPLFSQAQFSRDAKLRSVGFVSFEYVKGKKWFGLLPATYRQYKLYIGNQPVKIQVPFDFSLDSVILKTYFPQYDSFKELLQAQHGEKRINIYKDTRHKIKSGTVVKKGDTIISFDITLGDALFVDRLSYHFKKPEAGEPFVFKTSKMNLDAKTKQNLGEKYFIKRIGGVGGETISIADGQLLVNGEIRDEVDAFISNGNKEGEYKSYKADGLLSTGNNFTIPEDYFFALGDNSYNSHDSRYFGPVSKVAIIGKPCFIYYPFTKRWGQPK